MFQANPIVYCKFADEKRFQAYDINRGVPVGNIIYASMVANTPENQEKLQRLADLNKDQGLIIQLRWGGKKVGFQTA